MANTLQFQLQLIDKLSGPAIAGANALKAVEKQMKSVRSAQAIVGVKPIAVGSTASDKTIKSGQLAAEKAANKQRLAEEKAYAAQVKAIEKQLAAEQKAQAKAVAAQEKAVQKAAVAQAKQQQKAEGAAVKEIAKAKKAANADAAKTAKKLAADQAATGEGFAAQAELIGGAATAAAGAVLALAAAMGAAVIAGAGLALQASEAKGDTVDMLQAFLGSQEAAESTYAAIEDITRDVALSQGRAQELAQQLTAVGINNKDMLLDAIKSIGQVDSVIKGAGDKVQAVIERAQTAGKFSINAKQLVGTGVQMQELFQQIAKDTGKGVKTVEAQLKAGKISAETGVAALTKVIDTKFGGLAKNQNLDFSAQLTKFQDNVTRLFEDVDTGKFLAGLKSIIDLFDESTTSGKFLKETITGAFNGIFDAVSLVAPYAKAFFKGLIIIGLQAYIGLKPLLKSIGLIGSTSTSSGSGAKTLAVAMAKVGEVVGFVVSIFAKFAAHKSTLILLAIAAGVVVLPFVLMQAAVAAVIGALVGLLAIGAVVGDWLLNLGTQAWDAGSSLVDGLINGITGAAGKLIATVKGLGQDAVKAFRDVFQIHSPSRVMAGMGQNLSLGLAQGIMAGSPAVNDNMAAVVEPIAPPKASSGGSSVSNTTSLHGVNITITITGVQGAADLEARMPEIMANALEQAANTMGFQPAA